VSVFSAKQIKAWDEFTIRHEPVSSIDLMERAAQKCVDWISGHLPQNDTFAICCGKGNNGGDGLAIARLLYQQGKEVEVYIMEFGKLGSQDFQANLQRLHELPVAIHFIQSADLLPAFTPGAIIIDALYGTGLNKPLDGLSVDLVNQINNSGLPIISIDLPSGVFADESSKNNVAVKATYTLSFQVYKLALLLAENAANIGEVHILEIGLHSVFLKDEQPFYQVISETIIRNIFKPRQRFAHKGTYGHALIVGGSFGKIGAVVLATSACLRTGAGLVSCYVPRCGYEILQTSVPEAMTITDEHDLIITSLPSNISRFNAIGIGPGLGTDVQTQNAVKELLIHFPKPLVIDADGLNCIAQNKDWLELIPAYSILTPHPKEFERLFGECTNDVDRIKKAMEKAKAHGVIIVLKGHHTLIALPDGTAFFNMTGNAGMAKGGSGDVLTGIITSLCAQGYYAPDAALLGVYLHGLVGDLAARGLGMEAMIARDLVQFLSNGFQYLNQLKAETL
jgi:NAD(P)H-hydrate epimerase